jgi:CheY-like chemotaxis protein
VWEKAAFLPHEIARPQQEYHEPAIRGHVFYGTCFDCIVLIETTIRLAWNHPQANRLQFVMSISPSAAGSTFVVVVAEDEESLRVLVVEALTDEGFVALEAGHADEAIALLESQADSIHVLFTDHKMPGSMNGMALVHHVHGHWPWISLILTSGDVRPASTELPAGCRFLPKPYLPDHVLHHVRELVAAE